MSFEGELLDLSLNVKTDVRAPHIYGSPSHTQEQSTQDGLVAPGV